MPEHKTLSPTLKPPEFKRDAMGRFERPGATLKRAQNKKSVEKREDSRGENGHFQRGHNKPGPGRPPGSLNKTTLKLRESILLALDKLGGSDYLVALGRENSSAFSSLLGKILPTQLATDAESNGGVGVELRFVREIVWPDGHREVEGVTPKALPAPATPDASGT